MPPPFGPRRAAFVDVGEITGAARQPLSPEELCHFEAFDFLYRSLCALLYNYVPTSGHPGGSISAGRILAGIAFDGLDLDLAQPARDDADVLSFAAGHKAMGLYSLYALRDEVARLGAPGLLPRDARDRLRIEDLLGFRRNPTTHTPLFARLQSKALDGHPTPATPFVRLATGASGVGLASSIGLALAARDWFGADAPRVHVIEGEGGMTPGRVSEALAAAGTACLDNVVLHVDWNQSSIDSDRVCREDTVPGDYVQWDPAELLYLHDWNVVRVPDGRDFQQVIAAQRLALQQSNGQPTAIVYRTVKGWQYGIEGRASHGAGHGLCAPGFYESLRDLVEQSDCNLPSCAEGRPRCAGPGNGTVREACLWEALGLLRTCLEQSAPLVSTLADRLRNSRERLDTRHRAPRRGAPHVDAIYALAADAARPGALALAAGESTTLRGELGKALRHLNAASGGGVLVAAADLLGSTSLGTAAAAYPKGFWNARTNPDSRTLALGGICEDAMAGILSGIAAFGRHLPVGSSYGAFLAPLGHIAARLHAIGSQARAPHAPPYNPMVLVCAHAGLKTGEDGPTHADPQALQLLQENFPRGTAITLTPWEPGEVWPLLAAALSLRPALIAPFVPRPTETVPDREALGLAPAAAATTGVYLLRAPRGAGDGTVVLQESGVTYNFVTEVLPLLEKDGIDLWVYSVASAELFDLLPVAEQRRVLPEARTAEAIGITGFTMPTLFRWVRSELGREMSLHPFAGGHFLGSGAGEKVLAEAGLDGTSQYRAIRRFLDARARSRSPVTGTAATPGASRPAAARS